MTSPTFFFLIQLESVPGLPLFLRTIILEFQNFFSVCFVCFWPFWTNQTHRAGCSRHSSSHIYYFFNQHSIFSCTSVIQKELFVFFVCFFLMINQAFNIINSHHVTSCITGAKEWWLLKTGQLWSLKSLNYLWWVILGIIHKRDQFTTILLENTP